MRHSIGCAASGCHEMRLESEDEDYGIFSTVKRGFSLEDRRY